MFSLILETAIIETQLKQLGKKGMQLNPIAASEPSSAAKTVAKPVETGTADKSTVTLQDDKITISGESEPTYETYGSGGVDIPDPPKEK